MRQGPSNKGKQAYKQSKRANAPVLDLLRKDGKRRKALDRDLTRNMHRSIGKRNGR